VWRRLYGGDVFYELSLSLKKSIYATLWIFSLSLTDTCEKRGAVCLILNLLSVF
jgi:hypothetical protein